MSLLIGGVWLLLFAGTASAQDRDPCAADMVCASAPQSVFAAMEAAELDPVMATDGIGDPMIESDAEAFHFDVYFYGCEEHRNCDSLRFEVAFSPGDFNTIELANDWNASKRFLQASVKEDGRFALAYDVGTIGGLNQRNFADVLDWWHSMLEEFQEFVQQRVSVSQTEPETVAVPGK
ncbi:YbjN domain-containing protein [Stakelama tenebrarum]|uniref:YbjN domain-containing protein n=1 Tax=Stakelama tenebrarum TaxID=2711215 RepID=A0A6G6Y6C5_9SPHN|nr:YbjN domain-containing protein [Sphingosinithalassobacter tenebrarum]QIG80347.1 YbjN domain-containing protein [Sphingosinithalassobacter tenebrarum]